MKTHVIINTLDNTSCTVDHEKQVVHFYATKMNEGGMATPKNPNTYTFAEIRKHDDGTYAHWKEVVLLFDSGPIIIDTN